MSNYFQSNSGHGQQPPLPNAPPPNNTHHLNQMRPYAILGSAGNSSRGNNNSYAGQNSNQYNMGPPNQGGFSYSSLGSHGTMRDDRPNYSRNNNYSSMVDPQMHGSNNNGFKYSTMGNSGTRPGGNQQQMSRWNAPQQQQQQQQQQQRQYHHQDYLGHSYNQNQPPAPSSHSNTSYMPNNNNSNATSNSGYGQQPPLPVATPPLPPLPLPPPPPLPAETYSNTQKRTRWDNHNQGEASANANASVLRELRDAEPKPPLPPAPAPAPTPPAPKKSKEPTKTDDAVDAINALSNLQSRWAVPGGEKRQEGMTYNQKKRVRRNRAKKRKNGNNDGSSSNELVTIDDAGGMGHTWIDVEDASASSTKKRKPDGQKEFDLVSNPNNTFPPLASKSQGGDDVARLVTLEDMSTSQLTSYATVLGGALDQASKNQDVHDDDEEMDISDEEEEEVDNSKSNEKFVEVPQEYVIDLTEAVVDLTGAASDSDAPNSVVSPRGTDTEQPPKQDLELIEKEKHALKLAELRAKTASLRGTDTVKPPKQDLELIEKEKRALKLAELKARAKLARAKLRIAEQKKARGSMARVSVDSSNNESTSQLNNTRTASSPMAVSTSPLPTKLRPITIGRLVIDDVALTGPADEVRFVSSVYKLSTRDDQHIQEEDQVKDSNNSTTPAKVPAQKAGLSSEDNRKKSESLKQKLQLARLQLEILKKRKALSANEKNESNQPRLPNDSCDKNQLKEQNKEGNGHDIVEQESDTSVLNEDNVMNTQEETVDDTPSYKQTHAKLEQLRRRQKELKQKNDIANMRNLIHKQRDMLQAQGRELTESSTQLQSCADAIQSKQTLLDESERRLEEMNHRKRIVEGMVFRATEQLIAARKTLCERRRHQNNV